METVTVRFCPDSEHRALRATISAFRAGTVLDSIAIQRGDTIEYRCCKRCGLRMAMAIDAPELAPIAADPCPNCRGSTKVRGVVCLDCVGTGRRHIPGSCDDCGDLMLIPATRSMSRVRILCVPCGDRGHRI